VCSVEIRERRGGEEAIVHLYVDLGIVPGSESATLKSSPTCSRQRALNPH
jgi:hypothetical protein